MLENPRRGRHASKRFYNKCSENSRYQIVFRTDIFPKIVVGCPWQKGFSIFHCNIRSLEKNKSLLHDILSTVKTTPDIIAISESKINDNTSANLNIPGYAFVNTNSKTQAGGGIKASCQSCSQTIFNMPVMSTNTIPDMHRSRIFT